MAIYIRSPRIWSVLILLIGVAPATSGLDINSSHDLRYFPGDDPQFQVDETGEITAYGDLDMQDTHDITSLNQLDGFFGDCSGDDVVQGISDDGSFTCTAPGAGAQNLSDVLTQGNVANASIAFEGGIEIGDASTTTGDGNAVSIGKGGSVTSSAGIAVGDSASADGSWESVAIGSGAGVSESYGVALGRDASVSNPGGLALGTNAFSAGTNNGMAVGRNTNASNSYTTAVGGYAEALDTAATAYGYSADSTAEGGTAIGRAASTSGSWATTLGAFSAATATGAIAIGHNAVAPNAYEATFGNLDGEELDLNVTGDATVHGDLNLSGEGDINTGGGDLQMDWMGNIEQLGSLMFGNEAGEIQTVGTGDGAITLYDIWYDEPIAEFHEAGGGVDILGGDLNVSEDLDVHGDTTLHGPLSVESPGAMQVANGLELTDTSSNTIESYDTLYLETSSGSPSDIVLDPSGEVGIDGNLGMAGNNITDCAYINGVDCDELGGAGTLEEVLDGGNTAGDHNIDMEDNDIQSVDTLEVDYLTGGDEMGENGPHIWEDGEFHLDDRAQLVFGTDHHFEFRYDDTDDELKLSSYGGGTDYMTADQDGNIDIPSGDLDMQENAIDFSHDFGIESTTSEFIIWDDGTSAANFADDQSHVFGDLDVVGDLDMRDNDVEDVQRVRSPSGESLRLFSETTEDGVTLLQYDGDSWPVIAEFSHSDIRFRYDLDMDNQDITDVDTLYADTKNFVQSVNETHEAVYTSQESPDARAVVEGNATIERGTAQVDFPTHFTQVVSETEPTLRIQVTPHEYIPGSLGVINRSTAGFTVKGPEDQDISFDYRVTGIRDGLEDKEVVQSK